MKVIESLAEWKALRPRLADPLALVPTMGALHEGHLSLVRRARQENATVVVWIFVNPKQFGPQDDFERYPRDLARDLGLLSQLGTDYVLAPSVDQVYPPDFQTTVQVERVSQPLEGARRGGHFSGVATVVAKMLCLAQPRRAYFGQKDGQQCRVVQQLVADLGMLAEIVVCPTVRDPDGLALSSRNVYLTPEQRRAAPVLYRALSAVERAAGQGERDCDALRALMREVLAEEPLGEVEYASLADWATLAECRTLTGPTLVSLAVRFGTTRLIDNVLLPGPAPAGERGQA
jgi:pantoate--beta-alanine ligase